MGKNFNMDTIKVLMILADGFEEIEVAAPLDILRRAGAYVTLAALTGTEATGAHGICYKADCSLADVYDKDFDLLILPGGGGGTAKLAASEKVLTLIRRYKNENRRIAAICAAPTVLAKAEVINCVNLTSYPGTEDAFDAKYYSTEKVVTDGLFTTSRGPGTAIDFALELVELLYGMAKKEEVREQIVY